MKWFLFPLVTVLLLDTAEGQTISVKDLLSSISFSPKKFDKYLNKNKFLSTSRWFQQDTTINTYYQKIRKRKDTLPPVIRVIETYRHGPGFSFAFRTSSEEELKAGKKELIKEGFFCGNDLLTTNDLLFQQKNILVKVSTITDGDNDTLYTFLFHKEILPDIRGIQYADDLLRFDSHEYLAAVFGEKNVSKDQYFFSDHEISPCSVLFPHTSRQAVFLWKDEKNFCSLSSVLIGGDLPVGSLKNSSEHIWENAWMSKDGIYAGMSLRNLIRLNGNDFNFYGKRSTSPFMVLPEKKGVVNFRKNLVVLGFLDPGDTKVLNNTVVSTGDIAYDSQGIYVFMYMILSSEQEVMGGRQAKN